MGRFDRFSITPPSQRASEDRQEFIPVSHGEFAVPLEGVDGFATMRFIDLSPVGACTFVTIPSGFDRPFSFKVARTDPEWQISLRLTTCGRIDLQLPGVPPMGYLSPPGFQAIAVSTGEAIMTYDAPEGVSAMSVSASLNWIVESLGIETAPKMLRPFLERRAFDRMRRWDLAYTATVKRLQRELENIPYQGDSELLFLQARIIDGVVEFYQQLSGKVESATTLGAKERKLVLEAREILIGSVDAPPDLPTLARQVGTNAKKLTALFRAHFDATPFTLLQEYRLDRAKARLVEGAVNVSEAARLAGYAHPSNFIAAYRKRFGVTPGREQG